MITWGDCETTGLEDTDHLLEVALVVTDDDLAEVGATSVVVSPVGVTIDQLIPKMDPKVVKMHTDNGLFEEVRKTPLHRYEGEQKLVEFIKGIFKTVPPVEIDKCAQCGQQKGAHWDLAPPPGAPQRFTCQAEGYRGVEFVAKLVPALSQTPLAGSTVGFDRRVLSREMSKFEKLFSYRSIDVSSIVELAKRWAPQVYENRPKAEKGAAHRALADIRESINYLRFFKETEFINCSASAAGTRFDPNPLLARPKPSAPSLLAPGVERAAADLIGGAK